MIEAKRLLVMAEELVTRTRRGPPPQTLLRRAISTAYYALFHHVITAAADVLVGRRHRRTPRYTLVYRSFEHGKMRNVAELLDRQQLGDRAQAALGMAAPTQDIRDLATIFSTLQKQRHWADYDPSGKISASDARDLVEQAELAMETLDRIPAETRKNLLVFMMTSARG